MIPKGGLMKIIQVFFLYFLAMKTFKIAIITKLT